MARTTERTATRKFSRSIRRSLIRNSLRRQIVLAVVAVNLALIGVVGGLFLYYDHERNSHLLARVREDNERKVQKFRDVYLGFLQQAVSPEVTVPALIKWQGWQDMRYVKILRSDRSRVYINPKGARLLPRDVDDREVMLALVGTLEEGQERSGPAGGACIPLAFKAEQPWGAIYLLPEPAPPPDVPRLPFAGLFGTLAGGTLLLVLVTYVLLDRLVLSPLTGLVGDARRLARGDYDTATHVHTDRYDEVARLSLAIAHLRHELAAYRDDMTGRVQRALERARTSERHLEIAQRLAATGKLAAGLAHEINNPLAGMLNMVRRLRRDDLEPAKREQYLRLIEDSLKRIETTLGHLMASTPRQAIEPALVEVRQAVEGALALVRHRLDRQGITAETRFPDRPLRLFADRGSLQQIFLNLFLNATDAMPDGGRLTVTCRARGEDEDDDEAEHGEIEVRVADTGVGMAPEQCDRIFDLFYTTKPVGEGSGLGLGIVHTLVQDLAGRIRVESERGRGTAFVIVFPREAESDRGPGDRPGRA